MFDISRGSVSRLTFEGWSLFLNWTRNGKRVVFDSFRPGGAYLLWQPSDGSGPAEPLLSDALEAYSDLRWTVSYPGSWSPDGEHLAFVVFGWDERLDGHADVWVLRAEDRRAVPFLETEFDEGYPEFSPDGHWLAYA